MQSVTHRPGSRAILGAAPVRRLSRAAALAAVLTATLAGCAVPPTSTLLSRLPEGQAGAAPAQAAPLTPEERKRYEAIDKQVLREQNEALAADALARSYYYAPTPVYSGYYGSYYGGYYGGWSPGWGYGYGYPGWGWGW